MHLYRAAYLHTPLSPFAGGTLEGQQDGGLLVDAAGTIQATGDFAALQAQHPGAEVVDLRGGFLLPGLIDTHVHYPQVRVIGGLGMPLLDWLERCALPEEARLSDLGYARAVAQEFVGGLVAAGTTTALIFGAHFAGAVDILFQETTRRGLRAVSGLVVSDRLLRSELHTTPQRAYDEGLELARRWHGVGRNLYAVTPRFALSCSPELLEACGALLREVDGARFTSHINENGAEIAAVRELFPHSPDYLGSYEGAGLIGRRSVLAHNVHPQPRELSSMAQHQCSVAHCPCSNSALGSGMFPLRSHLAAGVNVALGSDVGGGTGFSLFKEGLQAYFMQQSQSDGVPLSAAHLLYLATLAGAQALDLQDTVGSFEVGKQFDALWLRPAPDSTLATVLNHAPDAERALSAIFSLGTPSDVAGVWIGGDRVKG